jgi:hypothetical protein
LTSIELATVVVAGTAVVLAPVDPSPLRGDKPEPAPAPNTPAFAALLIAHAEAELSAKVRTALGMPGRHMIEEEGETARRVGMWSQHELNAVYERVGGTVTTRTVQRSTHGGESTWDATEITVTVDLPGIGTIEIVTDWDEEYGGRDLPLMRAIPDATLIASDGAYEPHEDAGHHLADQLIGMPSDAAWHFVDTAVATARAVADPYADNATVLIADIRP